MKPGGAKSTKNDQNQAPPPKKTPPKKTDKNMKEESEYERYARLKSGDGAADEYREHSLNMETGVDSHLHPAKKRRTQIKNHLNTIFFWIRRKMCVK